MERKVTFSVGEYYHVYNRGVDKRSIFLLKDDYERLLKLLYLSNGTRAFEFRKIQDKSLSEIDRGEPLVAIGAYCLMPNHFHILVKEIVEGGMSDFMGKLTTGYAKYFNLKNKRTGALFEQRFKAEHADNDEYLKYLFAYIHLNPVKLIDSKWKEEGIRDLARARVHLEQYRYSSYEDYLGLEREEGMILNRKEFPDYFETVNEFGDFINDWLEFNPTHVSDLSIADDRLPLFSGRRSSAQFSL